MSTSLFIGIAGHLDIHPNCIDASEKAVREVLEALRSACAPAQVKLLCSLADGADSLCARVAGAMGIGVVAVLPKPAEAFRLEHENPEHFDALLAAAESVEALPLSPLPYKAAADDIAERSHILLALWDGREPEPGDEGGTAYSVALRRGELAQGSLMDRMSRLGPVLPISVRRKNTPKAENPESARRTEKKAKAQALAMARRVGRLSKDMETAFPKPGLYGAEVLFQRADEAAIALHRKLSRIQRAAAISAVAAFLLQQAGAITGIALLSAGSVGLLLIVLVAIRALRSDEVQQRFLATRTYAEALRVLIHALPQGRHAALRSAQFAESANWIMRCAWAGIAGSPVQTSKAAQAWIKEQSAYFTRSAERLAKRRRRLDRSAWGLYVGALLLTGATTLGISFSDLGGLLPGTLIFAAAFMEHQVHVQALADHSARYSSLAMLFKLAESSPIHDTKVNEELAREILSELGSWYSVHQSRPPEAVRV